MQYRCYNMYNNLVMKLIDTDLMAITLSDIRVTREEIQGNQLPRYTALQTKVSSGQ